MEIRYKSDANHNYMILPKEKGNTRPGHEKMVIRNQIRGLLKTNLHFIDNEGFYYYEIQSKQSLTRLCEGREMKRNELAALLQGIAELFRELEQYLLPADEVLFHPECIYLDPDSFEPSFAYYPAAGGSERIRGDLAELTQFLIDHADRSDRECQTLAYDYFTSVEDGIYSPDSLLNQAGFSCRKADKQDRFFEEEEEEFCPEGNQEFWEIEEDNSDLDYYLKGENEETDNEKPFRLALICFGMIVAAAVVYLLLVLNPSVFPFTVSETEYMTAGCVIAVLFGAALTFVIFFYHRKKLQKEQEKQELREEKISKTRQDPMTKLEIDDRPEREFGRAEAEEGKTVLLNPGICQRKPAELRGRIGGKETGIVIDRSPFLLGKKNERVDGMIRDGSVSRIHASIYSQNGKYFLSDMNSTNGTYINGRRLEVNETAALENGDTVGFANVTMTFQNQRSNPA